MPQTDPMTITEVTLGEVYRLQLAQVETLKGISEGLQKRPTWDDINRIEDTQNQAIKNLEDGSRWLVRTVAATALTALAGLLGVIFNAASRLAG